MSKKGKLYLIPVPLGEGAQHTIPAYVADIVHQVKFYIAERAKTARHHIKATQPPYPISELSISELDKHTPAANLAAYLKPAEDGHDMGLLSEAGVPGVADPGALVVHLAHQKGIEVVPLVGPSAILLALMASGMNGQSFAFQGYLPPARHELAQELKKLELLSQRLHQTQIFIETPYRNQAWVEAALQALQPSTLLCIAADITLPEAYIRTLPVGEWKKNPPPKLHKRPAVFLLYAGSAKP